ncbi:hypothetical protein SLS64_013777 [Diaporthe eres]|uniref:Uncharacterized protein n=1 Tax=Diaporthe eres TaxID=83184 RepID=A0ABR1P3L6_DIAER
MRASTTILFIAGLVSTAFAADTIYFSDETCDTEIGSEGFSFLATGDKPLKEGAKAVKVTSFTDTWFAYQGNEDGKCKGDLIIRLDEGDEPENCYKVAELGIGCTRLCANALGGGECASKTA